MSRLERHAGTMLTWCSGNTEDIRRAIFQNSARRGSLSNEIQPTKQLHAEALSSFVLKIPRFDPVHSFSLDANLGKPPFEHTILEQPDQLFEDDDVDQPDALLSDSRIHKPVQTILARNRVPKILKRSRHGVPYPSLPPGIIKKIASACNRASGSKQSSISKESLKAIMEASDQYFEQVSEDLAAFAHHAGRKKIDESDIIGIMKRYGTSYMCSNTGRISWLMFNTDNESCRPLRHHSF